MPGPSIRSGAPLGTFPDSIHSNSLLELYILVVRTRCLFRNKLKLLLLLPSHLLVGEPIVEDRAVRATLRVCLAIFTTTLEPKSASRIIVTLFSATMAITEISWAEVVEPNAKSMLGSTSSLDVAVHRDVLSLVGLAGAGHVLKAGLGLALLLGGLAAFVRRFGLGLGFVRDVALDPAIASINSFAHFAPWDTDSISNIIVHLLTVPEAKSFGFGFQHAVVRNKPTTSRREQNLDAVHPLRQVIAPDDLGLLGFLGLPYRSLGSLLSVRLLLFLPRLKLLGAALGSLRLLNILLPFL